jgi:hypothetical protein
MMRVVLVVLTFLITEKASSVVFTSTYCHN